MQTSLIQRVSGQNDLPRWTIENQHATAEIYEHGAQLMHWQPKNQEPVLWLSAQSTFAPDKAIRGGVPLCFPWFGPKANDEQAPAHGIARIGNWRLTGFSQPDLHSNAVVFEPDEAMRAHPDWPDGCQVQHRVAIGAELEMNFSAYNAGQSTLEFEIALHSYFAVGDVRQIEILGLEAAKYFDKVAGVERDAEQAPIRFSGETDRVYSDIQSQCVIVDPIKNRQIVVRSASQSTVVWNPWIDKAARMNDFGSDEWTQMVCVETANIGRNRVRLEPGQTQVTSANIKLRPFV